MNRTQCLMTLDVAKDRMQDVRARIAAIVDADNGSMCYPHQWTWQNMIVELDRDIEWIGDRIAKWDEEQEKLRERNAIQS